VIKLIPVSELLPGMFLHKLEVFWVHDSRVRNQMLLTDPRQIAAIKESGIEKVWIDLAKSVPHASANSETLRVPEITPGGFDSEVERARQIFQQGKGQIMAMFNEARLGTSLDLTSASALVDDIAGSVKRHPSALLSVARLKNHDDYTWLHSMAVCALMVSLAQKMGYDDEQMLRAGMGGLLHDIGKASVPLAILNKPGKLTDEEFIIMQQHPIMGAQMLMEAEADADIIDIALHHHEKFDGSGYPHRLAGKGISELSRMTAVCDVYDAITSMRPYKEGWNPAEAMHRMASWSGHFDRAIFHMFVKSLGIYPVGSLVRLASGRVALVTEVGNTSLLRPKVNIFYSLRTQREIPPEALDLADSFCCDSIIGPEDSNLWQRFNLSSVWRAGATA
jgi:putative nucleotidyltransferase with HDIG domain